MRGKLCEQLMWELLTLLPGRDMGAYYMVDRDAVRLHVRFVGGEVWFYEWELEAVERLGVRYVAAHTVERWKSTARAAQELLT